MKWRWIMVDVEDMELGHATEVVDEFILSFCLENKYPPLLASAVILARLLHVNRIAHSEDDYTRLLQSVLEGILNKEFTVPKQLH